MSTDEPATPVVVAWAAEQAIRMHRGGGRCKMCPTSGQCRHLAWALRQDNEVRPQRP